jgi:TldD protein
MLTDQIAQDIIAEGISNGATFVDLFVEKKNSNRVRVLDGLVKETVGGIDFGVGIRLLFGQGPSTQVIYGHTNRVDREELLRITRLLIESQGQLKKSGKNSGQSALNFSAPPLSSARAGLIDIDKNQAIDEKIQYLQRFHEHFSKASPLIKKIDGSMTQVKQEISVFNSEGLRASDQRHYFRLFVDAQAEKQGEHHSAYIAPGSFAGSEAITKMDIRQHAENLGRMLLTKFDAVACPAGKMPVVIGNQFGGVIFHEACGHLLETTSVEKKASVFWDKKGERIAHTAVNAVDDGTLSGLYGQLSYDDEGMPTQKTQLIKDGVLTNFMCDRVGHLKTGHPRTGSGRRQSYQFAPASRMRNTYIEAGKDSFDDMITSIDHGIFCKSMGGGSVNPGTGEFNFSALESYLIVKGKITSPLKAAVLIGTGPDILTKISMVGKDLDYAAGTCGSVSGSIPVTVGQPTLKVDEILVGGQK